MTRESSGAPAPPESPPAPANNSRAPLSVPTQLFLRLLSCVSDVMFSVLDMADDGACTVLYVSPGVLGLLGYTAEEYTALGCVAAA
jgi:hypothetical protein